MGTSSLLNGRYVDECRCTKSCSRVPEIDRNREGARYPATSLSRDLEGREKEKARHFADFAKGMPTFANILEKELRGRMFTFVNILESAGILPDRKEGLVPIGAAFVPHCMAL